MVTTIPRKLVISNAPLEKRCHHGEWPMELCAGQGREECPMKAFLCHSSSEKEYVRTIARRLTRARVVFDEMHFLPGEDFRNAIARGLDASRLFVFVVAATH